MKKLLPVPAKSLFVLLTKSKLVDVMGAFPLPVEVIPMARSFIARELVKLGGQPEWRKDFITDNGNIILDVKNLKITNAVQLENDINKLAGVVTVGIFGNRPADVLILGTPDGARTVLSK